MGKAPQEVSRVWVVLPAMNESLALRRMAPKLKGLRSVLKESTLQVVVVDDGSSDDTSTVLSGDFSSGELSVLRHERNQGFGAALKSGLSFATKQGRAGDVVVTLDADDTQPIEVIPQLVAAISRGADIAVASRFRPGSKVVGVPRYRRLLSFLAAFVGKLIFGVPGIRDYTCNFRAYRWEVLSQLGLGENFNLGQGFEAALELLVRTSRLERSPKYEEVPFVLRYDIKPGRSKMAVGKTIKRSLLLLWKLR